MVPLGLMDKYIKRFWSKVEKTDTCWLWGGYCNEKGYGYFYDGKTMKRVHRIAYKLTRGSIPVDCELDHTCRVRNCVNPDHLEPVSHQVNCQRGIGSKTHCARDHEFTAENTRFSGRQRRCKMCEALGRLAQRRALCA